MKSLSRVRLFATPWTVAHEVPPSMEFSRQEYWRVLPFASPGDLPNPGIELRSPTLQADAFTIWPTREVIRRVREVKNKTFELGWISVWIEIELKLEIVLFSHSDMTDCDPMDCSLLGLSGHGISQARILGWVDIPSEKAMAPHSSILAWKIPWTEEPGRLQSMGSLRVGHDWATSLSLFTFMHWRRKWQPTPVFLPGESQGPGSLVGCHLWGRTESDTTEVT